MLMKLINDVIAHINYIKFYVNIINEIKKLRIDNLSDKKSEVF